MIVRLKNLIRKIESVNNVRLQDYRNSISFGAKGLFAIVDYINREQDAYWQAINIESQQVLSRQRFEVGDGQLIYHIAFYCSRDPDILLLVSPLECGGVIYFNEVLALNCFDDLSLFDESDFKNAFEFELVGVKRNDYRQYVSDWLELGRGRI